MKNLNLIIDGSFFFRRSLAATDFKPYMNEGEKVLDSDRTQGIYIRKVATDFASQINKFDDIGISKIVFCLDSGSWRKKLPNSIYKANRVKDEDKNWDMFNELNNQFISILKNQNVIISEIHDAEGDDMIYFWSKYLMSKGESSIIISSDNDLKQIISSRENKTFIIHNNIITSKFAFNSNFDTFLNPSTEVNNDIFNLDNELFEIRTKASLLSKLISDENRQVIIPEHIVLDKIIRGDKGDNVMPLFKGFGEKAFENFAAALDADFIDKKSLVDSIINNDEDSILKLIDYISKAKKLPADITRDELAEKIRMNTKLIVLDKRTIPIEILESFKNMIISTNPLTTPLPITEKINSMGALLDGTKYYNPSFENDDSIFKGIDIDEFEKSLSNK